ncbi:MAG: sodium:calcium antiporter [Acidimicrobiia bacterium]|nr:sodium:calcium antiporter [Acidimicrobiia bacterium]
MTTLGWLLVMVIGAVAIVWGAERFAEHLAEASARLGLSAFALALLLAGAEPEELATVITASARGVDGVAFGDVIGANAAIVTVALGVGAVVTVMPFGKRIRRYALGGLLTAVLAGPIVWDGNVGRIEGILLASGYVAFLTWIWRAERQPPALGETGELDEHAGHTGPVGRELVLVLVGLVALTAGSIALVEAVRRISQVEETQTRLGLVIVGFATAFELVVLAWSAGRRGITEAVVAGVVGSYAYNLTMSLGVGALVAPITISDAGTIRAPFVAMAGLLAGVVAVAARRNQLTRGTGWALVAAYPVFVVVALVA